MNAEIHPSAVVDPRARLGPGVRVGAGAVVGPEVTLGAGTEVGHHAVLEGRVEVGEHVRIGHGAVIGGRPQDLKYRDGTPSGVRIGRGTVIREYVTVHRATTPEGWTEIGEECLLMALSHVAHDCRVGDRAILINYAALTGHCVIGEQATIGGYTGLVPFTRVGRLAYVGGQGKVTRDLPPFMLADGAPAVVHGVNLVGLRRAGVPPEDRRLIQEAHRILYRSGLTPARALERLRRELPAVPVVQTLIDFVAAARRGICGPAAGRDRRPAGLAVAADGEDDA